VEAETGRRALAHACHVGYWRDVDRLVEAAYGTFGKVDVLVNNAGMSLLYDHVVNVTEELYDKVLAVNLKGPFRLTALVGTRMAAGAGGSLRAPPGGRALRDRRRGALPRERRGELYHGIDPQGGRRRALKLLSDPRRRPLAKTA